jgi:glucose 1-dehydrogenase
MKAIAVYPGQKNSAHLTELPAPSVDDIPNGRGVLVRVLRCGVDGTDKEINAAEYGAAPDGSDFLIMGHENFGRVESVGPNVTEFQPGDYVVATVRRRGNKIYDEIGTYDMTTDEVYFERGVSRRHGYMTEYYVHDPEYIVKVPAGLRDIAVIAEPLSVPRKVSSRRLKFSAGSKSGSRAKPRCWAPGPSACWPRSSCACAASK